MSWTREEYDRMRECELSIERITTTMKVLTGICGIGSSLFIAITIYYLSAISGNVVAIATIQTQMTTNQDTDNNIKADLGSVHSDIRDMQTDIHGINNSATFANEVLNTKLDALLKREEN